MRALIIRAPPLGSFDQLGTSPQRAVRSWCTRRRASSASCGRALDDDAGGVGGGDVPGRRRRVVQGLLDVELEAQVRVGSDADVPATHAVQYPTASDTDPIERRRVGVQDTHNSPPIGSAGDRVRRR